MMEYNQDSQSDEAARQAASNAILEISQRIEPELEQVRKTFEETMKQIDNALAILRATIESTTDGILVTDENANVLRYNERYLQIWQIPPEVADGAQHQQLLNFCSMYLTDSRQFLAKAAEVYASWPRHSDDLLEFADGRVFDQYSKVQYVNGKSIGRVWSFRDVTARKRAEDAARESGERLCFMADAMPQKIFTARPDGTFDYFNQQWKDYSGLDTGQLGGWQWTRLIHPDDLDESTTRWRASLATGEPFQAECRFRRANGGYSWHLIRAQAKRDAKGNISMWVGSNTDIDALKRADEEKRELLERERTARNEAEQASQSKDEFLATLSHELRTPLNAILGWSQLISQGTMGEEEVRRGQEIIERNARAQNKLIGDLLEMSSIVSGQVKLDVQREDIAGIAEAAIESVAPAAEARGIHLRKTIDPGAGLVSGDHNRLQQVIWNLLTNAVKFTPKGGTVEIIVERIASHIDVTVKDSGMGINPEFLEYVFDRFRQADSSLRRTHGGLGLGLSIVKQLVGLHGGTVRAESSGEGRGASFIVSLPLAPVNTRRSEQLPAAGSPLAPDSGKIRLTGIKVLVIDDEADARDLIGEVLTQCEADVITAANAAEGVELLKTQRPDVIISDIGMPEGDGYHLIREVRHLAAAQGGKTPAIALTAFAHSRDRTDALVAGYHTHLSKPVESHELIAAIGSLTGWRRKPAPTL
ncbi:MAG: response regulator [Nitrosospira sp.]|nr:response regulator [Nitrosospira sp.]